MISFIFRRIFSFFFYIQKLNFAVYNIFATAKAIKNQDYEFLSGEVVGKTDNGNYKVRGLEEQNISVFIGKKDYNPGERVIVARLNDELNIIAEH